jgi:Ca-activated chloride channel family protein
MNAFQFTQPGWFWLLDFILLISLWYVLNQSWIQSAITIPFGKFFRQSFTIKTALYHALIVLRLVACSALIFAMARPQFIEQEKSVQSEGTDIMIVLDISGSMLSKDFHP